MTTRIFLADDHPIVRQGMHKMLERVPTYEIVGEADNGLQAIREIEQLKPDIAILDIVMPDLSGLEICRQIKEHSLLTRVIILSMYSDEAYVREAIRFGAFGYVIKQSPPATLLSALMEVERGRRYLCPQLADRIINDYIRGVELNEKDDFENLTNREREMLYLVSGGLSNMDIARKLNISSRTVEVHRSRMMKKLGLSSQNDLIRFAIQKGIVKLNS